MPLEFYHTTIQYEQHFENDRDNIKKNLELVFRKHLKKIYKNDTISTGRSFSNAQSFSIKFLEINSMDDIKFSWEIPYANKDSTEWGADYIRSKIVFMDFFPDTLNNGKLQHLIEVCKIDSTYDAHVPLDNIFSIQFEESNRGCIFSVGKDFLGHSYIPDTLYLKLCDYIHAKNGFPSYSSGHFERMLYFSSITITTLGYGDILPLTPKARMLVSIEATWGIVLLGLFLNSLANKIAARK